MSQICDGQRNPRRAPQLLFYHKIPSFFSCMCDFRSRFGLNIHVCMCESVCKCTTLHAPLCPPNPPPKCLFTVTCLCSVSISVTGPGQVVFDWPLERIWERWRCQGSQGQRLPPGGGSWVGGPGCASQPWSSLFRCSVRKTVVSAPLTFHRAL